MEDNTSALDSMRHSLAHILAHAVQDLYRDVKFGVGPVIENGFYYDFDLEETISEDDLSKIENRMREIIKEGYKFTKENLSIDAAKKREKNNNQPYKLELIEDLQSKGTTKVGIDTVKGGDVVDVQYYTVGTFTDLCRGGHVESTADVGAFALTRVSGAYWRGDEKNPQMQRVYGVAFETQEELDVYLAQREEAKTRDHRKLGQELDLFTFSELVGSGLPLFTTKGTWLRELLGRYSQQIRQKKGFERVWIPHLTKQNLYQTSGHWEKFGDELFLVESQETSDKLALKPMNCPHHTQIYAAKQRSYKDLPLKFMENTTVYRDEKSGEMHGIERVRSITQDDCHVFCTKEQIRESIDDLITSVNELYTTVGLHIKRVHLSFRDESDAYLGDKTLWDEAQQTMTSLAEGSNLDFVVDEGEAAFYGPKIDFIAADAIGRETQVATIQLDFVQPQRFDLVYTDNNGAEQTPVMVHSALLGSIERFLAVYIEHTGGRFPLWLSPEQVRVLPVNDKVDEYVATVKSKFNEVVLMEPLKYNELRVTVDDRNESLGKRIREAEEQKVPVIAVVGPRDSSNRTVSLRINNEETTVNLDDIEEKITAHS